jgi:Fe-S-cluster containining protein
VADVLREKGCVTMVDVLVAMGRLAPGRVEEWRFGRVPFLERAVDGNLAALSAIGREVRAACEALGLEPSVTDYRSWGRGRKRLLRFSRSGAPAIEQAYATRWTSEAFRRGTHQEPAEAPAPKVRPPVLQPHVPIEKDPEKVRQLEAEKRDENFRLRAFLKWGGVPAALVDRLFHRIGAEVAAEIDCASCGACCRQLSPVLLPKDIERLARRLRVPNPDFRASHLRKEGEELVFARVPCPLLDGTRCSCYTDRPRDCRSYPHLLKKGMTSRLLAVLGNAAVCPIVFSTLERLKAELVERGFDWGAPEGDGGP